MLTTTRGEWSIRDAEEPVAPLRLSRSCSSSVPREGVPALYTRRTHAPSLYFHRQGTTEVDARRGAASLDHSANHARQGWHIVDRDLLALVEPATLLTQRLAPRTLGAQVPANNTRFVDGFFTGLGPIVGAAVAAVLNVGKGGSAQQDANLATALDKLPPQTIGMGPATPAE